MTDFGTAFNTKIQCKCHEILKLLKLNCESYAGLLSNENIANSITNIRKLVIALREKIKDA